jgi:Tol biopolymer transport system component
MRFSAITNFAGVEVQPAFSRDGRSVAFVLDRGGQYDIHVGLLSGGSLVRVTNDPNVEARPRWSPDGSKLLYARLNESGLWDIWAVPALGGVARKLVDNAADPAWSPDDRSIAYANLTTGGIWMCDPAGRGPRQITIAPVQERHRQPVFSRDGRRLAFVRRVATGGPYGELAVTEANTGQFRSLTDDGAFVGSPAWSPDGSFIYFASGRGGAINIWKVTVAGGQPEQITVGQGDDADLDVSTDGQRIVFSSYRININLEQIILNATRTPARVWLTADAAHGELGPGYSRDGKRIAYFTNRRGAESDAIWVMNADGGNPTPLAQDDRLNAYPRWSGDGRSLIFASRATGAGANRLWAQVDLRRVLLSGGAPQPVPFGVVDPTGDVGPQDQFLYRGVNGSAEIFDPKTNRRHALEGVNGAYLRWSPDGRRFGAIVNPRQPNDAAAGVWVYDLEGKRQQVFQGWASFYAWAGANELLILEGKPDLNAILWRARLDGSPLVAAGSIRLIYSYWHNVLLTRFDVHPEGSRIVAEALELHQADLSMIENIR